MKKLLSILLCLILVVSCLAACGGSTAPEVKEEKQTTAASENTEVKETAAVENEGEEKLDFGGQKIVMAMMNFAGAPAGLERVSNAISDIMTERYNIAFELLIMDSASYRQNMTLMLTSGEQVDIYNAITIGFTSCVNKEQCIDLEENDLIQTYGAGILETLNPAFVDACRVSGVLYGLPQQRDMAGGLGAFAIAAEYLDAIGYDYSSMYANEGDEIIYTTFEEIDSIFAQLHEAFPDKYVFAPQEATISQGPFMDAIGGDNFGVLLDPENSLVVEDLFGSQTFYDYCKMFYDWNQAGYISSDALTDDVAATAHVKAGNAMSYALATKPGIRQQETGLCGRPMIIFQCGEDFLKSSAVTNMAWCINSNCENPEAAMTVLNALYTDPELSTLICWGEEGVEWKETGDGHITFADGIDANTSEYYNNVNWELPNQFIAKIWEGDSLDLWERMEAFNSGSVKSKALGFSFDNSAVAAEYTALTNVYNAYYKTLFYGFTNPDEGIPAMVEELKEAGLDTYMAAKQEALDAWAAANGVQ